MSADDEKPPFDAALRHLAEQQRRSLTSHPTPQELAAYHAGELPPEAEARILDHLAICRECSDLLLDLSGFADLKPPAGMPELTDQQVEQDWQALRKRMGQGEERKERTAEVVPIRSAGPAPKSERTFPVWLPVAASLLAVLGFSFGLYQSSLVAKLERRFDERNLPWSPAAVSLDNETVRSGEQQDVKRITSEGGAILSLYPDSEVTFPAYEAEIVGRATVKATPPREEGLPIALVIPPRYLEPGRTYEIQLYGISGSERTGVGRYQIQVDEP